MNRRKWLLIVLHVLAWLVFFVVPGIMNPEPNHPPGSMRELSPPPQHHSDTFWLLFSSLKNLVLIPFFYLNTLYILPRMLPARRFGWLALIEAILMLIVFAYTQAMSAIVFPGTGGGPHKYASVLAYLIVLSVAVGFYYYRQALDMERSSKERENSALKSELQFLRWQISPHFLFNALNNMVALARKKSDLVEPMLINLSGLMRYMLYETGEAAVSLKREAQYLESYIDLQSIRYSGVELTTDLHVPDNPEYQIEPMLLIPFVENAFKHGIDGIFQPVITIRLHVVDDALLFEVSNKQSRQPSTQRDDASGIGLANVEKRLQLLYNGRHTLAIERGDWFKVCLKIALT